LTALEKGAVFLYVEVVQKGYDDEREIVYEELCHDAGGKLPLIYGVLSFVAGVAFFLV
jgi:hypothetical protein